MTICFSCPIKLLMVSWGRLSNSCDMSNSKLFMFNAQFLLFHWNKQLIIDCHWRNTLIGAMWHNHPSKINLFWLSLNAVTFYCRKCLLWLVIQDAFGVSAYFSCVNEADRRLLPIIEVIGQKILYPNLVHFHAQTFYLVICSNFISVFFVCLHARSVRRYACVLMGPDSNKMLTRLLEPILWHAGIVVYGNIINRYRNSLKSER